MVCDDAWCSNIIITRFEINPHTNLHFLWHYYFLCHSFILLVTIYKSVPSFYESSHFRQKMPNASVHMRELFNMITKEENIHDLKMKFLSSVKKIPSCLMCGISRGKNNHLSYKRLNIFFLNWNLCDSTVNLETRKSFKIRKSNTPLLKRFFIR